MSSNTKEYSLASYHKNKLVYSDCVCGHRVSKTGLSKHLKSMYHLNFVEGKKEFLPPPIKPDDEVILSRYEISKLPLDQQECATMKLRMRENGEIQCRCGHITTQKNLERHQLSDTCKNADNYYKRFLKTDYQIAEFDRKLQERLWGDN